MKTQIAIWPLLFLLFTSALAVDARGFELLSDSKMKGVTAGSLNSMADDGAALNRIPFSYRSDKGQVEGEVIVLPVADIQNQGSLLLMDNAQSNLRSLINVNAVNSPVQILLNLNININSTIGNVNQLNHLLAEPQPWR